MAIIYVSNSTANNFAVGLDSHTRAQAASMSLPMLTLNGAQLVAAAGDTIIINSGTYAENTVSNQLQINRAFGSMVTITSFTGVATDVLIKGSGSASNDVKILNNASNYTFSFVSFGGNTNTSGNTIGAGGTSFSHIYFLNCKFQIMTNGGFNSTFAAGSLSATDIIFNGCDFRAIAGQTNRAGVTVTASGVGNTIDGVQVINCIVDANDPSASPGGDGISVLSTNAVITGNQVTMNSTSAAYHPLMLGIDNTSSFGAISGVVANNYINTTNGHGLFIGCGGTGTVASPAVLVYNNISYNNLHGGGTKGGSGVVFINNLIVAGPRAISGFVFKANSNCGAFGNELIGFSGASNLESAKMVKDGTITTLKSLANTLRGNIFSAAGSTAQVEYLDSEAGFTNSTGSAGGTVSDYNYYFRTGGANYQLFGTPEATLALTVTLWPTLANYSGTTNDTHSVEAVTNTPTWNAKTTGTPGVAGYFVVRNQANQSQYWNSQTQAYEAYNASNWPLYAIPMWEQFRGYYVGMLPLAAATPYATYYQRTSLTAAPSPSDTGLYSTRSVTTSRSATTARSVTVARTITANKVVTH